MIKPIFTASLVASCLLVSGLALASGKAHWGYSGHEGPEHWGELSPEYATCSLGKNQSPIDVSGMVEGELQAIKFDYEAGGKEVLNNGHTIQVNYAPGSTIEVDGTRFELKQFHFHSPSENTIDGKSYPLEAHFVHADKSGNLAVVAVMFDKGDVNAELEKAWKQMPGHADEKAMLSSIIDASALLPKTRDYYRFNGSLTTPPCTEGVRWLVMKNIETASKAQIEQFSETVGFANNRPAQPLNARMIVQ